MKEHYKRELSKIADANRDVDQARKHCARKDFEVERANYNADVERVK
jgi:hypothetical protein